jgi:signal transduction histidine kinase
MKVYTSPEFIKKLYDKPFSSIDRWFAILRLLVILGGFTWLFIAPLTTEHRILLLYNFVFFCFYSLILYWVIFRIPEHLSTVYLIALVLDLIFLYWLVHYTGGFQSDFFLGFFLLIALHSFYFGMKIGITVVFLSTVVYMLGGSLNFSNISAVQLALRLTFFLLVAVSMGLLSRKAELDHDNINKLNQELDNRRKELEQEKEKLENILVGIGAGLVLVNRDMKIEWMNKVAESWFGQLHKQKNVPCSAALWGKQIQCPNCPTAKSFESGKVEQMDFACRFSMVRTQYFRLTAAPIRDASGKTINVLELIQDITEEKALQAQLLQSSKLAAIGELASGIAHEINNPLSSIVVCVEELAEFVRNGHANDVPHGDDILECIQSIKSDIYRCKRITSGFLNFSRRKETRFEPVDINQILMNTALLTRYKAQKGHNEINFYLSSSLPLVMAEADEITQVFLNILINAMDFSPPGRSIDVHTEPYKDDKIVILVEDEGCGIAKENINNIFSTFFTSKPPGKGTGLGLPISKRIVQRHGGSIEVNSVLNHGTSVKVILPVDPG